MTVKISCRVILCRALPFGAMASLGSASLHAVGGILARSAAVRRGTRAVRADRQLPHDIDIEAVSADVVAELFAGGAGDLADLAGTSR